MLPDSHAHILDVCKISSDMSLDIQIINLMINLLGDNGIQPTSSKSSKNISSLNNLENSSINNKENSLITDKNNLSNHLINQQKKPNLKNTNKNTNKSNSIIVNDKIIERIYSLNDLLSCEILQPIRRTFIGNFKKLFGLF